MFCDPDCCDPSYCYYADDDSVDPDVEASMWSAIYHSPGSHVGLLGPTKPAAEQAGSRSGTMRPIGENEHEGSDSGVVCLNGFVGEELEGSDSGFASMKKSSDEAEEQEAEESISTINLTSDSDSSVQVLDDSHSTVDSVVYCSSQSSLESLDATNLRHLSPSLNTYARDTPDRDLSSDDEEDLEQIFARMPDDPERWKIDERDRLAKVGNRYYTADAQTGSRFNARKRFPCYICGSMAHRGRFCPQRACLICFSFGHTSEECRVSRRALCSFRCGRCNQLGHEEADCPDLWRQFHSTLTLDGPSLNRGQQVTKPPERIWCCNCAQCGHTCFECPKTTNCQNRILFFKPTTTVYDTAGSYAASCQRYSAIPNGTFSRKLHTEQKMQKAAMAKNRRRKKNKAVKYTVDTKGDNQNWTNTGYRVEDLLEIGEDRPIERKQMRREQKEFLPDEQLESIAFIRHASKKLAKKREPQPKKLEPRCSEAPPKRKPTRVNTSASSKEETTTKNNPTCGNKMANGKNSKKKKRRKKPTEGVQKASPATAQNLKSAADGVEPDGGGYKVKVVKSGGKNSGSTLKKKFSWEQSASPHKNNGWF